MDHEDWESSKSEPYTPVCDGQRFYFDHPDRFSYSLDNIAPALAKMNRFTGHTDGFLSVAEHAVLVSFMVPPELAYTALHHDDVEAFIGDHSSPLKRHIPALRDLARSIEPFIARDLGFIYPFPHEIHEADQWALGIESRDVMPERTAWREIPVQWRSLAVLGLEWHGAEESYRRRHWQLLAEMRRLAA